MTLKKIYLALLFLISFNCFSQFELDGEFRPRTEYRHGFGNFLPEGENAGTATSTRSRLNAKYYTEDYTFYLSLQDVMVWGENRQLKTEDSNNSFAIFEAWASIKLGEGFSTKIGRQIISYDDQRILGAVGWAQQSRSHDAALLKYNKNKFSMDLGLAFNQDFSHPTGFNSVSTTYNTTGFFSYKTMQFLHLSQQYNNISASLLLLNNGFQNFDIDGNGDGVSNLQTIGTHLSYKKGSFGSTFNAYLQTGERQGSAKVSGAHLLGLDINYAATDKIKFGIGAELFSGNNANTTDKIEAFFPLYGTNHKFNGFMDYFYVGNHANSIGLIDLHASANIKTGEKSNLMVKLLNFSGEQKLPSGEKSLGSEIDLMYNQNFKGYNIKLGYSHLFPSDGMYELKGTTKANTESGENWAWVMLTIKPKFLNTANN